MNVICRIGMCVAAALSTAQAIGVASERARPLGELAGGANVVGGRDGRQGWGP